MFEIIWQDVVLALGNVVLCIGLLPSLLSKDKPAFLTSISAAPTLTIFAVAFFSLELYLSSIGAGIGALGWWILAAQKYFSDRSPR